MKKMLVEKIWLNLCSPSRLLKNFFVMISNGIFFTKTYMLGPIALSYLTLSLMVKYKGQGVPIRQLAMLDISVNVTRILDRHEVDYVLICGALLGAVRQGAFAGRPYDFDIAYRHQDHEKLLKLYPIFQANNLHIGYISGRQQKFFVVPKLLRFQRRYARIDAQPFIPYENGWKKNRFDYEGPRISFVIDFPKRGSEKYAEIFSYKFKIPANSLDYLEAVYGKDWRIPDSRQFAWFPQENRDDI